MGTSFTIKYWSWASANLQVRHRCNNLELFPTMSKEATCLLNLQIASSLLNTKSVKKLKLVTSCRHHLSHLPREASRLLFQTSAKDWPIRKQTDNTRGQKMKTSY